MTDVTLISIDRMLPGAVVYGGYLRDTLLHRRINDIDIAVPANCHPISDFGFQPVSDYDHDHIHCVWRHPNTLLNVIEMVQSVTPTSMNEYCDFGICKISWSASQGLVRDPRFDRDVENHTLTLYRHDWGQEGVERHLQRLIAKYPGWRVIR